jgi:hypothetical protein
MGSVVGVIVLILMLITATVYVAIRIVRLLVERVFHRPIEHYGFVVCMVGIVFSVPLSGMAMHANKFRWFCLWLCSFWVLAVLAVGFLSAYLFRRSRFPRGPVATATLAALFGLSTGFFWAATDQPTRVDGPHWYEAPAFLAAPGAIIAELVGLDVSECDEGPMWSYCHKIIVISNAIVWPIIAITIGRQFTLRSGHTIRLPSYVTIQQTLVSVQKLVRKR